MMMMSSNSNMTIVLLCRTGHVKPWRTLRALINLICGRTLHGKHAPSAVKFFLKLSESGSYLGSLHST